MISLAAPPARLAAKLQSEPTRQHHENKLNTTICKIIKLIARNKPMMNGVLMAVRKICAQINNDQILASMTKTKTERLAQMKT